MKKQLFILMLALLALGTSNSYAQTMVPRVPECVVLDNPLSPVPGNLYTYTVDVPTPDGDKSFRWFVTQDQNFISNGVLTTDYQDTQNDGGSILFSAESHYTNLTANADSIRLTWQSWEYDPAAPVFVVVEVRNLGPDGCETMNLKAYKIQPIHAFTLDIANVDPATELPVGYDVNVEQCISAIASAVYDFDNNQVNYDFGQNTLHYAVVAANWSLGYELSIRVGALEAGQTVDIFWGYTFNSETDTVTTGGGAGEYTAGIVRPQGGNSVGSEGEEIFIKVVVHHGTQFEGTLESTYTISVDGILVDATDTAITGMADIHHEGATCEQAPYDDTASQTLTARPAVNEVTPGMLPITE